jgi:predicted oxidoreductase
MMCSCVHQFGIVFPDQPVQYLDNSAAYLNRAVGIALEQLHTTYIDVICPHAPDPLLVCTCRISNLN